MDVKRRIAVIRLLERMQKEEAFCRQIGLSDVSSFRDKTAQTKDQYHFRVSGGAVSGCKC